MTSATTIEVFDLFTVTADQHLEFTDQGAFVLRGPHHAGDPAVINQGEVSVLSFIDGASIDGVTTAPGESGDSSAFHNEAGASLSVNAGGADSTARGVVLEFDANSVLNEGGIDVRAKGSATAVFTSRSLDMVNHGTIVASSRGLATGVEIQRHGSMTNNGAIEVSGGEAIGVTMKAGDFVNNDTMRIAAKVGDAVGVVMGQPGHLLANTGIIHVEAKEVEGAFSYGMVLADSGPVGVYELNNSRILHAHFAVFEDVRADGLASQVIIDNSGVIGGDVVLRGADDTILNHQKIGGDVWLGGGDDVYEGSDGGVRGTLYGEDGRDLLVGGRNGESLSGGDGDDTLVGGLGHDRLAGGEGADTFRFTKLADSPSAWPDVIQDLDNADIIDLSAIDANHSLAGDQDFVLVGHFTGHAGELKLTYRPGIDATLLEGDIDGNGAAEFQVMIAGDHNDFAGLVL